MKTGTTLWYIAILEQSGIEFDSAKIGLPGRYFESIFAVSPVLERTAIPRSFISCDRLETALQSAFSPRVTSGKSIDSSSILSCRNTPFAASVSMMISFIALTASTGYFPIADSFDSITASVPSHTALATSLTSARVGSGFSIMELSISVAVIVIFPRRFASWIIIFCAVGTFA